MPSPDPSQRAAEVARASYGKLVAVLASRSGDIMAAEDALADAFLQALTLWPIRGIPDNPAGWLMTTARNRATDAVRRMSRGPVAHGVELPEVAALDDAADADGFPDRRLSLLFVCAHPEIDAAIHTPLMLQTVLGVEAVDIARAFLQSPTAVAQRLVRAKRKIRDAQLPFEVPPEAQRQRLPAVLEAVYAAYVVDWTHDESASDLTREALYLAELLAQLLPDAETAGLAALLAFTHARRRARLRDGVFVPLAEQDPTLWDHELMARAREWLARASTMKRLGRFQLEAAMQQAHGNPRVLLPLVDGLCSLWPTAGAAVSRAAIVGEAWGPAAGLAALDAIEGDLAAFQPAHATRAHLLAQRGDHAAARASYATAIALTTSTPVRRWLQQQHDALAA